MVQGTRNQNQHPVDDSTSPLFQDIKSKHFLLEMPLHVLVEIARHSTGLMAGTAFSTHSVRSIGNKEELNNRCDEQRLRQVDRGDLLI